ncbi:hypothetical protein TYRP_015051 [Tyrophagus putrescentiae]|nr:hypothetical protein TYRP_015051 [Tyrophagus putrescentiae]
MSAVTRLYSERRAMYKRLHLLDDVRPLRRAELRTFRGGDELLNLDAVLRLHQPQAQVNLGDDGGGGLGALLLGTLNLRPGLLEAARLEDAQLGHRLVRQAVLPLQQGRVEAGEDGGQLPGQLLANLPPHRAVGQLGESPLQLGRLIQALQRLKGLVHRFGHLLRVPPAGFTVHKEGQQVLYLLSSAAEVLKDGQEEEEEEENSRTKKAPISISTISSKFPPKLPLRPIISDCIVSITVTAFWRMFRFLCFRFTLLRSAVPAGELAQVDGVLLQLGGFSFCLLNVVALGAGGEVGEEGGQLLGDHFRRQPAFHYTLWTSIFRAEVLLQCGHFADLSQLTVADVRLRVGLLEVLVLEQLRPLEHAVDAALDQVHLAPAGVHLALQLGHLADQTLEAEREVGAHGAGAQRRNGAGHQRARHHQIQPGHEEGAGGGGAAEGAHAVAHLGRRLGALLRAGHRRLQLVQLDVQLACLNRIFIRASSLTDFLRGAQVDFVCLFHLALHLLQQQVKYLNTPNKWFSLPPAGDAGADLAQLAGNRRVLHLRLGLVVGALQLVQLLEGEAE